MWSPVCDFITLDPKRESEKKKEKMNQKRILIIKNNF